MFWVSQRRSQDLRGLTGKKARIKERRFVKKDDAK